MRNLNINSQHSSGNCESAIVSMGVSVCLKASINNNYL